MINADATSRPVSRPRRESPAGAVVLYGVAAVLLLVVGGGIYWYTQSGKKDAKAGVEKTPAAAVAATTTATTTGTTTKEPATPVVQKETELTVNLSAIMDSGEIRKPANLSIYLIPLTDEVKAGMKKLLSDSEAMSAEVRAEMLKLSQAEAGGASKEESEEALAAALSKLKGRMEEHAIKMVSVVTADRRAQLLKTSKDGTVQETIPEGKYLLLTEDWQDADSPVEFDGADSMKWCVVFDTTGKKTSLNIDRQRAVPQPLALASSVGDLMTLRWYAGQLTDRPDREAAKLRRETLKDNLWEFVNQIDPINERGTRILRENLESLPPDTAVLPFLVSGSAEFKKLSEKDRQRLAAVGWKVVNFGKDSLKLKEIKFWDKHQSLHKALEWMADSIKGVFALSRGDRVRDLELQMLEVTFTLERLPKEEQQLLVDLARMSEQRGFDSLMNEHLRYLMQHPCQAWAFKKHMQTARAARAKNERSGNK